jgi:hypothetical protein
MSDKAAIDKMLAGITNPLLLETKIVYIKSRIHEGIIAGAKVEAEDWEYLPPLNTVEDK